MIITFRQTLTLVICKGETIYSITYSFVKRLTFRYMSTINSINNNNVLWAQNI